MFNISQTINMTRKREEASLSLVDMLSFLCALKIIGTADIGDISCRSYTTNYIIYD